MNNANPYQGFRFNRARPSVPPRAIAVGVSLLVVTLLWWLVPRATLYWLILPLVGIAVWVASYGWRSALAALHDLLHRLEGL